MNLKHFAEEIGVSQPTVSKVLNNCFGVDGKTRAFVREEARRRGLLPAEGTADVFCILPDTPTYFWRPVFEGLYTCALPEVVRAKFNVYSRLSDEDAVLAYLEQAQVLQCRALIVAAVVTPRIQERLEAMAVHGMVILLNQYAPVCNTLYVGEDAHAAGRLLGESCRRLLAARPRVMQVSTGQTVNARRRSEGFWEAAKAAGAVPAGHIRINLPDPVSASQLARELAKAPAFDCLYCNDGILVQAALALEKLKRQPAVPCIGFEHPAGGQKYRESGAIAACVMQDPAAQGQTAMELARSYLQTDTFPPEKCRCLPSAVWVHPRYRET